MPDRSGKTREKLIEVAGGLFAEYGFNIVTVGDIAAETQTHLSAVNYHFKTKEAIYREVLREACRSDTIADQDCKRLLSLAPHQALMNLVQEALAKYRQKDARGWRSILLMRECRSPGPLFKEVLRDHLQPETDFRARLIGQIVKKPAQDQQVRFAALTMMGLVETFGMSSRLSDSIAPGMVDHFDRQTGLATQIVRLVLEAAAPSINLTYCQALS